MSKPLLLLDVDGVLNCFGAELTFDESTHEIVPMSMADSDQMIRCVVDRKLKGRVALLQAHFDLVWCTAWQENAHPAWQRTLELSGDPWPYIEFSGWGGYLERYQSWKRRWVEEFVVARKRPFAWVDDDLHDSDFHWLADLPVQGLLVQTRPHRGLDDANTNILVKWASVVASS